MSTYYVDLTQTMPASWGSYSGNNGLSSSAPWYGIGGLQRALYAVLAGETIFVKAATVTGKNLIRFAHSSGMTGTVAIGDTVTQGSASGIVCYISTSVVWVEQTVGGWTASGQLVKNAGTNYVTYTSFTVPGVTGQVDGSAAAGRVRLIGVNASWVADGTNRPTIDATGCVCGLVLRDWMEVDHFSVTNSTAPACTSHGINGNGKSYLFMFNCAASGAAGAGFSGFNSAVILACTASGNSTHGFSVGNVTLLQDCYSINNGSTYGGFTMATYSVAMNCIAANNYNGFAVTGVGTVLGCTIHGNTNYGVSVTNASVIIQRCRISSNGVWGMYSGAATSPVEDWNVFYGNGGDTGATSTHDIGGATGHNTVSMGNSVHVSTTTALGYVNTAGGDYSLTPAATSRRLSSTIGGASGTTISYRAIGGVFPTDEMTSATAVLKTDIDAQAANIIPGTTFGSYGPIGSFDEEARNTDPGEANVIAGNNYKILNVSKTAAFNLASYESGRNTDPGVSNVVAGVTYKIANVSKTGTLASVVDVTIEGAEITIE